MKCPRCQAENQPQAKFCEECATPLARTCANCGTQLSATAKFCPECAIPLLDLLYRPVLVLPSPTRPNTSQIVTVLFADLKGSMELLADRDPEEARKLLDPVLEHMMEAVHRYEGSVNQVMGDGMLFRSKPRQL